LRVLIFPGEAVLSEIGEVRSGCGHQARCEVRESPKGIQRAAGCVTPRGAGLRQVC
jgi:hypothetical protein